jgi:hypothetical protein
MFNKKIIFLLAIIVIGMGCHSTPDILKADRLRKVEELSC